MPLAIGGTLALSQDLTGPPAATGGHALVLASTSPQRRAILEQLGISFEVVAPSYLEHDPPGLDAVEAVRAHAAGKARSVGGQAPGRIVLGVDTAVVLDGRTYGKPDDEAAATATLGALAGRTHEVVSGLCLVAPGVEVVEHAVTCVTFRALSPGVIRAYIAAREWEGRAGGYAIQGRGAALVERIDGDYLNVVGLPGALLVRVLEERLPGLYALAG